VDLRRASHKRNIFYGLILFLLMAGTSQGAQEEGFPLLESGMEVPGFSLPDFSGGEFRLSDRLESSDGLLLWFTNLCPGCQAKLSEMEKIKVHYGEKDVEVVAVSVLGEDRKPVEEVLEGEKSTLRFLYDPAGEVTRRFSGEYVPGTCPRQNIFLIDKEGKILRAGHYPGVEEKELGDWLDKMAKGAQP